MDFLKRATSAFTRSVMPEKDRAPISSVDEQPQDEQELVSYIRNKVGEARNSASRVAFEQIALTNTAYLMGYDAVQFNTNLRQFLPVAYSGAGANGGRSKAHTNLILPNIQNRLARLLKNPPKYDVLPEMDTVDGKDAANLSLKVVNNTWDKEKIDEKRIELGMWMQQAGHGWIKTSWNPMKGKPLPYQQQEMADLTSAITDPQPVNDEIHFEGDIDVDVCSPFEVFVDPLAKNQEEMQWLIHAKVRKISYFRDHYKERGDLVKSEGAWLLSIQNLFKINNMNSRGSAGGGNDDKAMENSAIELAYFEKPTRKYPNGRMIITANGVLLKYDELPIGEIPYTKFDDVKIGGKFYSESLITHLRPIQDQYNRSQARKAEMVNKGLALKIMAGKGHGFTQESMNDNTEILEYNHVENTAEPKQLRPPEIPNFVFTEDANLKGNFAEIAGISEPSKGQIPSASIPGVGLQLLIESDDTRIGIVTTSNENSWAQVGRHIAKYAAKYYKTTRYLKEAGEDGEYSFTEFTGEDLRDSFDVRVKKGSTLPNSKVLKRQETINLFDKMLLGDPQDPMVRMQTLKDLEYGDMDGAWEDLRVNMQQVNRTIKQMEEGQAPVVNLDDDHSIHYALKNRLRKTPKFESYDPMIQQIFLDNISQHKLYMTYPELTMPPPPMPPMPPPGMPTEGPGLMPEGEPLPPMDQSFEQYPVDEIIPEELPIEPGLLDMSPEQFNASL